MKIAFRKRILLIFATLALSIVLANGAWADQNSITDRLKEYFNHRCEYKQGKDRLTLASDGQARFLIVVHKGAPAPVRFAGQELKYYLDRITGANFDIASKHRAGLKAIILGDGPEARELGVDVDTISRDGYNIIANNNIIVIAGRDDPTAKSNILFDLSEEGASDSIRRADLQAPHWDFERGSLYGTYRFLEQLGIRWFFPGPKGEVVPSKKTLTIQFFTIHDEPSYALRYPWPISATRNYLKFRSRSGHIDPQMEEYADIKWTGRANYLWFLRMRGSSEWFAFNHRPPLHHWLQRFSDTHPEYFAVKADGQRDIQANTKSGRRHGNLCYSEEGVFNETMKDIEAFFSGKTARSRGIPKEKATAFAFNRGWHPNASYADTFSLLPKDGWQGCFCDRCQSKILKHLGQGGKLSGIIWPFVEKVARATEKRFPDKAIICTAYSSYSVIPEDVKLPDNVIVGCGPRLLNKTYNCVNPKRRKQLMASVTKLDGTNDTPLLYWFHHLFRWKNRDHFGAPMLLPRFMNSFIRDLSKHGRMMFMQMDFDSVIQEHLNRYVFMRTLYDTSTNVNELIHDYTQSFYGNQAGPIIEAMIHDIEKRSERMAAAGPKNSWWGVSIDPIWTDYFPPKVVNDYREQVDRAFKIAGEEPYREHVRLFSEYFIGFMEKGLTRWKKSQTK